MQGARRRPRAARQCPSFFLQAEDGIRDTSVTGVQTCALPIYARVVEAPAGGRGADDAARSHGEGIAHRLLVRGARAVDLDVVEHQLAERAHARVALRSEERRVGKEWRARWTVEH